MTSLYPCQICGLASEFRGLGDSLHCSYWCREHVPVDERLWSCNLHPICIIPRCLKSAHFTKKDGGGLTELCHTHGRLDPTYHLSSGRCVVAGCETSASFGEIGGIMQYCGKHSLHESINLRQVKCCVDGCDITAHYGVVGSIATHCASHGNPFGLIYLHKVKCEQCDTQASFALPGHKAAFCVTHKPEGAINIRTRYCTFKNDNGEQCTVAACFGPPGSSGKKDAVFCASHKPPGYFNVSRSFCISCVSEKSPTPKHRTNGYLWKPRTVCNGHRLQLGVQANNLLSDNDPWCEESDCDQKATHANRPQNVPKRCINHLLPFDLPFSERKCSKCEHLLFLRDGLELCDGCSGYTIRQDCHEKEDAVQGLFEQQSLPFRRNRTVDVGDRTFYRLDFEINPTENTSNIVVEVDEHYHKYYDSKAEIKRMVDIQKQANCPVTFIRFNPDMFTVVGKVLNIPISERYRRLLTLIRTLLNRPLSHSLCWIYLYYPEDTNQEFKELIIGPDCQILGEVFIPQEIMASIEIRPVESKSKSISQILEKRCDGDCGHVRGESLPIDQFGSDNTTSDGYRSRCKGCRRTITQNAARKQKQRRETGEKWVPKAEQVIVLCSQCKAPLDHPLGNGGTGSKCSPCNTANARAAYEAAKPAKQAKRQRVEEEKKQEKKTLLDSLPEKKLCIDHGTMVPTSHFNKLTKSADGLASWCKAHEAMRRSGTIKPSDVPDYKTRESEAPENMKWCVHCDKYVSHSLFTASTHKDCRVCRFALAQAEVVKKKQKVK